MEKIYIEILMFLTYYSIILGFINLFKTFKIERFLLNYLIIFCMGFVYFFITIIFKKINIDKNILSFNNFILKFYYINTSIYLFKNFKEIRVFIKEEEISTI